MKLYKKRWLKITSSILLVLVLIFSAFYIYTLDYYRATPVAVQAMQQTKTLSVQQNGNMIVFAPKSSSGTGLIFYPGAKVEYTAYAPLMTALSKQGVTCVLMKMPFNLAVFDVNAADRAIQSLPTIKSWYLGGHSLGGAMASSYASNHAQKLAGLVLLGAYPSSDLSHTNIKLLTMYGANDKVLNRQKLSDTKTNAPKNAQYIEIAGGNHAYFGTYGDQKGDGTANITAEEQQKQAAAAIMSLISK